MTARRKAAGSHPVPVADMHIPEALLAGQMHEVWDPQSHNYINTSCRYVTARNDWLTLNGYSLNVSDSHKLPALFTDWQRFPEWGPFSLAEWRRDDPEGAAAYLTSRGLPVDFEPRPA